MYTIISYIFTVFKNLLFIIYIRDLIDDMSNRGGGNTVLFSALVNCGLQNNK